MSIDSFYNVFYFSDPVAYQLNAAVDCKLSKSRPPLAISPVGSSFSVNTISRYLPASLRKQLEGKPQRPGAIRLPSGLEMLGPTGEEKLEGSRGERRFSALNPHGSIDFYLPSSGPSEYLGRLLVPAKLMCRYDYFARILLDGRFVCGFPPDGDLLNAVRSYADWLGIGIGFSSHHNMRCHTVDSAGRRTLKLFLRFPSLTTIFLLHLFP